MKERRQYLHTYETEVYVMGAVLYIATSYCWASQSRKPAKPVCHCM